jgi:hypothetical protein
VFVAKWIMCVQLRFECQLRFYGVYARSAKALDNDLEIGRVLVRQHLAAMFKGIARVETEDLLPLGAGFFGTAQMTKTRILCLTSSGRCEPRP